MVRPANLRLTGEISNGASSKKVLRGGLVLATSSYSRSLNLVNVPVTFNCARVKVA